MLVANTTIIRAVYAFIFVSLFGILIFFLCTTFHSDKPFWASNLFGFLLLNIETRLYLLYTKDWTFTRLATLTRQALTWLLFMMIMAPTPPVIIMGVRAGVQKHSYNVLTWVGAALLIPGFWALVAMQWYRDGH